MPTTDTDECRATGVWPTRPMSPFEPLPLRLTAQSSRARRALEIARCVTVSLILLSAAGGIVYVLATGQT